MHTASLSNCPCVRVSSRTCCFSGVHNFPLSIFSFRRMCMCRISPFFRRNRSAFPSVSLYWFDFWALPLYWYWFQRLPNKLPKLASLMAFRVPRTCWRALFPVPRGKVRYVRAPLQPILSMMSPMWGVCLLVDFSRLSKNRLNPKRAHSCLAAVFGNFWTCSTLFWFWRDILEKMKLILTFCSICERENFLKHRFPCAFPSLAIWGLTFNWSKLRISVDFWVSVFDIFFRLCELISP